MSGTALPSPLDALGFEAKGVCAAWFGMMLPGEGRLVFGMKEQRPSARAQACLDEIVAAGIARREDGADGSVSYVPLVGCSPLLAWLEANSKDARLRFPLTEKVSPGAREGFSMTVSGPDGAAEAAAEAARLTEEGRREGRKDA